VYVYIAGGVLAISSSELGLGTGKEQGNDDGSDATPIPHMCLPEIADWKSDPVSRAWTLSALSEHARAESQFVGE
jgi:hypothetical protein